jgi:hypothetical protein
MTTQLKPTAIRTRSTAKTNLVGSGAYSASTPASTGPSPSPAMFTAAASRLACARRASGARSMIAAVAVPVTIPAERPDRTRPTNNHASAAGSRNATALSADNANPAIIIGRRPSSSDQWPNSSSPTMTPTA